jgi:hypothetical protein
MSGTGVTMSNNIMPASAGGSNAGSAVSSSSPMVITDAYNGKFPSSMGGLTAQYENAYKGGYVPSVHSNLKDLTSRSSRSARSSSYVKSQSMKMKRKKGKKTQGKGKKTQGGRQAPWTKKNRTRSKR